MSKGTANNEVPANNYKDINELMNVEPINNEVSDADFNIMIDEFEYSVKKEYTRN